MGLQLTADKKSTQKILLWKTDPDPNLEKSHLLINPTLEIPR